MTKKKITSRPGFLVRSSTMTAMATRLAKAALACLGQ